VYVVNHFLLSKRLVIVITLVSRNIKGFIRDLKSSRKLIVVFLISAAGGADVDLKIGLTWPEHMMRWDLG